MIKCRECGKEKLENEYRLNGKKADGTNKYRQPCKTCISKTKSKNTKLGQLDHDIQVNKKCNCGLTKNDVKKLKELIAISNHKKPEITISENNVMVDYEFNKKNRLKSTYNIEKEIKELLENYCNTNLRNSSDVVNLALIKFLRP